MNFFKIFAVISFFLVDCNFAFSKCATVYFYRPNGIQIDEAVLLYTDKDQIAKVELGERYEATICTPGTYEFVVKSENDDMALIKTKVAVKKEGEYYLKIVNNLVASIKKMDLQKGEKEFNRASKFNGQIKTININQSSGGGGIVQSGKKGGVFQSSQVVNNIQFDITEIIRAGDMVMMNMKFTNLTNDDIKLSGFGYDFYFYDDRGNLNTTNTICIMDNCEDYRSLTTLKPATVREEVYGGFNHGGAVRVILPYGITVDGKIIIRGVSNDATKFKRGTMIMRMARLNNLKNPTDFQVHWKEMVFPDPVDVSDPNKRIFGRQSIRLNTAENDNSSTAIHFSHMNESSEPYIMKITGATIYDSNGKNYRMDNLSFVEKKKESINSRDWKSLVNGNSKLDYYIYTDQVILNADQIRRITVNYEGYDLTWENIPVKKGQNPVSNDYLTYNNLIEKLNKNENVIGRKVVMKNIYFATGSDDILSSSYPQLDELANLFHLNDAFKIEISGHTDNVGDDISNMLLSQKRADAIRYYLIGKSVDPKKMTSVGKGKNEPVHNNDTEAMRKMNRRVEILVVE